MWAYSFTYFLLLLLLSSDQILKPAWPRRDHDLQLFIHFVRNSALLRLTIFFIIIDYTDENHKIAVRGQDEGEGLLY